MEQKNIYLLDGSFTSGVKPYVDFESLVKHPLWGSQLLNLDEEAVYNCHRDYIKAGVDMITTNTYQASINGFQKFLGLNYCESYELLKKSVKLCKKAIQVEGLGKYVKVMGSVGPFGASKCDGSEYSGNYIDSMSTQELLDWHKPRIQALIEEGVDYILFETIPSIREAKILLKLLSSFPDQKACLSFSCRDELHISHGETFSSAVETCWAYQNQKQLVAIGCNCVSASNITSLLLSVKTENVPLIVYPNGGGTWDIQNKKWDNSKAYQINLDDIILWKSKGLKIFGGCCVYDSSDIARFRNLIDSIPL
ncbi:homocysteine S-methyltransferase YbgG-like [Daktulosphaira vitifoliae]|uniref:homocysteine S-methyltransferase YbgG-like n=1 Tax=Daktulosphaira vitifoliae TaxID=58002 RepID=UPI0021AA9D68|nr:homocysteine S-methyltransferase YbgG-like [Daktulosphaira vitifoliae]